METVGKNGILVEYDDASTSFELVDESSRFVEGLGPGWDNLEIRALFLLPGVGDNDRLISRLLNYSEWMLIYPKSLRNAVHTQLEIRFGVDKIDLHELPIENSKLQDSIIENASQNLAPYISSEKFLPSQYRIRSLQKLTVEGRSELLTEYWTRAHRFARAHPKYFVLAGLIVVSTILFVLEKQFNFYAKWQGAYTVLQSTQFDITSDELRAGQRRVVDVLMSDFLKEPYFWQRSEALSDSLLQGKGDSNRLIVIDNYSSDATNGMGEFDTSRTFLSAGIVMVRGNQLRFALTLNEIQSKSPSFGIMFGRGSQPLIIRQTAERNGDLLFVASEFDSLEHAILNDHNFPDILILNKSRFDHYSDRRRQFREVFNYNYKQFRYAGDFALTTPDVFVDSTLFEASPSFYRFFIKRFDTPHSFIGRIGYNLKRELPIFQYYRASENTMSFYENVDDGFRAIQSGELNAFLVSSIDYVRLKSTGKYVDLFVFDPPLESIEYRLLFPKSDRHSKISIDRAFDVIEYYVKNGSNRRSYSDLSELCKNYVNDNQQSIIEWFPLRKSWEESNPY